MIEASCNYGPHLKPPSYRELKNPMLKKELEYSQEMLKFNMGPRVHITHL